MKLDKIYILFSFLITNSIYATNTPPNIIFFIIDDLGWNDIGFHGSNQIPTPNIDALAYSGVILQNYHVNWLCTPSRTSLMTGKYPIHLGMQSFVLRANEARGLPLSEKLLPEYLKSLGYMNHMIGKWHLGFYKKEYTPTYRGFDSYLGGWTAKLDYNDHTAIEYDTWGLDMHRNLEPDYESHGQHTIDLYADEAVHVINDHNKSKPLFLYLAHNAVHSGNFYNMYPVPDETAAEFGNITDYQRQRFAGLVSKVDESVGRVVETLSANNMLENSVIVFTTDNGGGSKEYYGNVGSNWPLRGMKNTLWEGGVRGAGFLWSPLIEKPQRISNQMMHIADWLPTLMHVAGLNLSELPTDIDGFDLWSELSHDTESKRDTILYNIDDHTGASGVRVGDWKLIKGTPLNGTLDVWVGDAGRTGDYDANLVINSKTGKVLMKMNMAASEDDMILLRGNADVRCPEIEEIPCNPLASSCLFNIPNDLCEQQNLAQKYPNILQKLEETLNAFNDTVVPPSNLPADPKSDPKYWNYVWSTFGDDIGSHI